MKVRSAFYLSSVYLIFLLACKKPSEVLPISTTLNVADITSNEARCGGAVNGKEITEKGVCWNTTGNPTTSDNKTSDGKGDASYLSDVSNLKPLTKYYLRAYATNKAGTGYGIEKIFVTAANNTSTVPLVPVLTTYSVTSITKNSAIASGTISLNGNTSVQSVGVCWSVSQNPSISDFKIISPAGSLSISANISGLTENSVYYVRLFATTTGITYYGNVVSFITGGRVTDVDGNVYKTITVGGREWMAENLRVIHFSDGSSIPVASGAASGVWSSAHSSYYSIYSDNPANSIVYGNLYNWYTLVDAKGLAPVGWHIATKDEWVKLIEDVGGYSVAGSKLKENGTTHWSNSSVSTNESGFTGLGSGFRDNVGVYKNLLLSTGYWSKTPDGSSNGFYVELDNSNNITIKSDAKNFGFSVRCVRD